jgi:hypothetical protein
MHTRTEFLQAILPAEGIYVAVAIDEKRVAQTFHDTVSELEARCDELIKKQQNTFYALATFNTASTRTTDNMKLIRSLFVDLDCGVDEEGKKYTTQAEAVAALREFTKDMRLPTPWVVDSGRGIHAYWPFTEAVTRLQWKPVAEKLKQMCAIKGFKADPAVTADAVRVLRVPGSFNVKDKANPLAVEIMKVGVATPFDDLRKLLGVSEFEASAVKRPMDEVTKALLANRPSYFKDILQRSVAGDGCNQIMHAVGNQSSIPEPLWRAVLSVAQHCHDRDKAIHVASKQHPDYDPDETERKASATKGPYTCASFQKIDPTLCEGCPHLGKISSPITLGAGRVLEATQEDRTVEVVLPESTEPVVYEIPAYPFPFFRGKNGGVYVREKVEDKKTGATHEEDTLIYQHDFYLVAQISDPHDGATGLFRVHFPQDGVKEFCVPLSDMLAKDRFRDAIATVGMCPQGAQLDKLMAYSNYWVNTYQKSSQSKLGRVQFGWADNNQSFIVGDREIRDDEIRYSPPTITTVEIAAKYQKAGTLEGWQKIANFYNQPGMELQLFTLLSGFASPLMPFTKTQGGVISLYSDKGGTGKTTLLWMINSIFGHPKDTCLILRDTVLSRLNRVGVLNNISATTDEITNELPENISAFIYDALHGRARNRMKSSSNVERVNKSTWNNINVVTGNAALADKLRLLKEDPDGELRRMLEFEVMLPIKISKAESDNIFLPMMDNYGVAGELYIQHLLPKTDTIHDTFRKVQLKLDAAAGLQQREQYQSVISAAILTAGIYAMECGVMNLTSADMKRLYQWVVNHLTELKEKTANETVPLDEVLGLFLSNHVNDTLIIKGNPTLGNMLDAPIREPRGKLLIRYEPDTKELCVSLPKFRAYCAHRQVSYDSVISYFTREGKFREVTRKRLGKGTHISANERVIVFANIDEDFVGNADKRASAGTANPD